MVPTLFHLLYNCLVISLFISSDLLWLAISQSFTVPFSRVCFEITNQNPQNRTQFFETLVQQETYAILLPAQMTPEFLAHFRVSTSSFTSSWPMKIKDLKFPKLVKLYIKTMVVVCKGRILPSRVSDWVKTQFWKRFKKGLSESGINQLVTIYN